MTASHRHDVLIIGSGAAGLSLALRLSANLSIAVLSKRELREGNTLYAQGGISAVFDADDSVESHVRDTLNAGAGLCDEATVRQVVEHGPNNIRWLFDEGVKFTRDAQYKDAEGYHLTREGGHSHRRVVHAADATGRAVEDTLEDQIRNRPNVDLFEHHTAVDLIDAARVDPRTRTSAGPSTTAGESRCIGAYSLNSLSGEVETFLARFVVIATGGASKVYLYTSNPDVATGDGIAMAWRAGCRARTWSSSSSIRPASITPRPSPFWSPRRCAAKAHGCCCRTASASCRASTSAPSWRRATSSPAPSTTR
jgi:L-aspartate oxidase